MYMRFCHRHPMATPAHLRVILQDHDIHKLALPSGIPGTVDELVSIVRETFGIAGNFNLHYKDADFGDEYFSLTSTRDIKVKDTIKVAYISEPPMVTLTFTDVESSAASASDSSIQPVDDGVSSGSQDTVILSSPESVSHRSQVWPSGFPIPRFAYDTELVLECGNEAFKRDGTLLNSTAILPDSLQKVAEGIFQCVAYPSNLQMSHVADALILKHPCLKEPGSFNGCYGCQQRMKYKMGNFRTKLRGLGCPELDVNSLKRKAAHERLPAKNVKKPRKAEVNYLPPHPQGETVESLEKERMELLNEVKKRNNSQVDGEKMARTLTFCRKEVVDLNPPSRNDGRLFLTRHR